MSDQSGIMRTKRTSLFLMTVNRRNWYFFLSSGLSTSSPQSSGIDSSSLPRDSHLRPQSIVNFIFYATGTSFLPFHDYREWQGHHVELRAVKTDMSLCLSRKTNYNSLFTNAFPSLGCKDIKAGGKLFPYFTNPP